MPAHTIPIVDLFAGPGGLGEGFSAFCPKTGEFKGKNPFKIKISIEMDKYAYKTLFFRSFFRNLSKNGPVPDFYYKVIRNGDINNLKNLVYENGSSRLEEAYEEAEKEARQICLGSNNADEVEKLIKNAIGNHKNWVLIGGPPCQAYSLAGRARNKGIEGYQIEKDHRSHLYKEYLKVIAGGLPAIFVMENVKGMLSAKLNGRPVIQQIIRDLEEPGLAVEGSSFKSRRTRYRIVPAVRPEHQEIGTKNLFPLDGKAIDERDFIVRCELFGIPQQRHRVIIIGIREDLLENNKAFQNNSWQIRPHEGDCPTIHQVIGDLPKLTSRLSNREEGGKRIKAGGTWEELNSFMRGSFTPGANVPAWAWLREYFKNGGVNKRIAKRVRVSARRICRSFKNQGGHFVYVDEKNNFYNSHLTDWFFDEKLKGVANHESRLHLDTDLARYLFSASFAIEKMESPNLKDFPSILIPKHKSADTGHFNDRFRVQIRNRFATTITCHLSKDGHYFIHYDPIQCRSLTVREAARIQTFPDNYFFCGPRTSQFTQVGNAVPPYLALKLAESVWELLKHSN